MGARDHAAEVLAAHQRLVSGGACVCGEWPPLAHNVPWSTHLADALADAGLLPEGETREEWRIDGPGGPSYAIDQSHPEAEKWTRLVAAQSEGRYPVRRSVTTYRDHVTDWQEAPDA